MRKLFETTSSAEAVALFRRLGVDYIYVGKVDRDTYPPQGLAKFEVMRGRNLNLVYKRDRTRIYRVLAP